MLRLFTCGLLTSHCLAAPLALKSDAAPIDQVPIHEKGCGPISLLNAYRFSSIEWRATTARLTGTPEDQFNYLIRKFGKRISPHAYGQMRWNDATGMRPRDLLDFTNEFHKKAKLPSLSFSELFLKKNEDHQALLKRTRASLEHSINNGFPPIVSISRFAKIKSTGGAHRWGQVTSHFVTIVNVQQEEAHNPISVEYIDPWGGQKLSGKIKIPTAPFYASNISSRKNKGLRKSPCLIAELHSSSVGLNLLTGNTPNVLIVASLISANKAPATIEK